MRALRHELRRDVAVVLAPNDVVTADGVRRDDQLVHVAEPRSVSGARTVEQPGVPGFGEADCRGNAVAEENDTRTHARDADTRRRPAAVEDATPGPGRS